MNAPKTTPPGREWNAQAYHRVSEPQYRWGLKVLERLTLTGSEAVMDAGCGSGRLTAELLERLPSGRVLAVDISQNMLAQARAQLLPRFAGRVSFWQADLATVTTAEPVDVIFSTATFHWVLDHEALFESLFRCLKPGGRLHAQCGGGDNLVRTYGRAERILREPPYAALIEQGPHPTLFAGVPETAARLQAAGFAQVQVSLEQAPTVLPDRESYRAFLQTVILRVPLELVPDVALREGLLDRMCEFGAADAPAWSLDYVRLNLAATKPRT